MANNNNADAMDWSADNISDTPIDMESLPGYRVYDDDIFYRPVFQDRPIDPSLFTPTLKEYLAYSPTLSEDDQACIEAARQELANKNPVRVGNRIAGIAHYLGRARNRGERPSTRRIQAIYDKYFSHDSMKRRKHQGSQFDIGVNNAAAAITRELVALLRTDRTYRLTKLCLEWDWGYVDGRK
jgi:hypothetical protein